MHVRSVFTSYLARIGWRGRSSARLESWWPHTRTSLGLFPRCSRSAALLQDGRGGQKGREKEQRCLVEFAEKNVFFAAVCSASHPLDFSSRDVHPPGVLPLYFDPRVSSLLSNKKTACVIISARRHPNGPRSQTPSSCISSSLFL